MLTIVSGFGRCGTSMVMQMLAAGGAPVVGTHPDYEVEEVMFDVLPLSWAQGLGDRAVKVLDPRRHIPPKELETRYIWLDRNPKEQAKSQIKFLRQVVQVRGRANRVAASLREDRKHAVAFISRQPHMIFRFEEILAFPLQVAQRFGDWFPGFDADAAARAVIRRSPDCAPDLRIEAALMLGLRPGASTRT